MDFKKELRVTLVWWMLLFVVLFAVMYYVSENKEIMISDNNPLLEEKIGDPDGSSDEKNVAEDMEEQRVNLTVQNTSAKRNIIQIQLPASIRPEAVSVENKYLNQEVDVWVKGVGEDDLPSFSIQGDANLVEAAMCEKRRGGLLFRIQVKQICEYQSSMDAGTLKIQAYDWHDLYTNVIVIDPEVMQETTEKDILLQISNQLNAQFDLKNAKLLFVRSEDVVLDMEEKIAFIETVKPDFYIGLTVMGGNELMQSEITSKDAAWSHYGIMGFYNEEYVIPQCGNAWLADVMTRNVTIASMNRAVGLENAPEDSILKQLCIPAATISLGYMTNEKETSLLKKDAYRELIVKGLLEGLKEVDTKYHESDYFCYRKCR